MKLRVRVFHKLRILYTLSVNSANHDMAMSLFMTFADDLGKQFLTFVIEQKIPFLKILEYTSVVSLLKKIFDMRGVVIIVGSTNGISN